MSVVCIPYRSDGGLRDRARDYTQAWWEGTGREVVYGSDEGEPFSPSKAKNAAARNAGDWTVALFCDADCVLGAGSQADEAADLALRQKAYVIAHSRICYLEDEATETVYAGVKPDCSMTTDKVRLTSETCFAVHRRLWDKVRGFDERFIGWGWQGLCFQMACLRLGQVTRVKGDVFHLWHGPYWNERPPNPHLPANSELAYRYKQANDVEMLELVNEWR